MKVSIFLSAITKTFTKDWFNFIISDLVTDWFELMDIKKDLIFKMIEGSKIYLEDKQYFTYTGSGKKYNEGTDLSTNEIFIATLPKDDTPIKDRVEHLIRHGLSHIIYAKITKSLNEEEHHKFFAKTGIDQIC